MHRRDSRLYSTREGWQVIVAAAVALEVAGALGHFVQGIFG